MPPTVTIDPARTLPDRDIASMLDLHARYFANVREAAFRSDLAEKDWVIRLHEGNTLVGFSTQQLLTLPVDGRTRRFLFSGDTVVAHTHRNQFGLAGGFGHLFLRLLAAASDAELYWFLICKGYRTYRFLPLFFERFLPVRAAAPRTNEGLTSTSNIESEHRTSKGAIGVERSAFDVGRSSCHQRSQEGGHGPFSIDSMGKGLKRLLDAVAAAKFATSYDAAQGLVRHAGRRDRLRAAWARRDSERLEDPLVRFFVDRNPGWRDGDELACIAPLSHDNMKPAAWRVIRATTPVWSGGA